MSRATIGDLLATLAAVENHEARDAIAASVADVVGEILAANPVDRAARGSVLVQCLRLTAAQAKLCGDGKDIDAELNRARLEAGMPP